MRNERSERIYHPWLHDWSHDGLIQIEDTPDSIEEDDYKLDEGILCSSWFPENVLFEMSEEGGKVLADSVPNHALLHIVSPRLKDLLEIHAKDCIEFLPIGILDHKKFPVETPYYIMNVLRTLPCMDEERSDFVRSAIDKSQVHHIKRLVLDEDQIPDDANIFRLGQERDLILVRSDLAEAIKREGMTGIYFMAIEDYGKQYRKSNREEMIKRLLAEKGRLGKE
ncbi:hypothetical protein RCC89_13540 [Cytophagaceae bacterium ABcell3]|nr:hypothetical protein RCC89_13540 [Cytophagaceae bacterium ABcell3]